MDNFRMANTEREQNRSDFSVTFLHDMMNAEPYGCDPYNHIGLGFGFNWPRAMEIFERRLFDGTL